MDTLAQAVTAIGCTVTAGTPTRNRWGEYDPTRHHIVLLHTLAPVQRHSTLAHELGHAAHRHVGTCPRQEAEADRFAHWLTIPLCQYLNATRAYDSPQDVALELGIMPSDVRSYTLRFGVPNGDNTRRKRPPSAP